MRSLESLGRNKNLDMSRNAEGINGYANKINDEPKSFEEHMRELISIIKI